LASSTGVTTNDPRASDSPACGSIADVTPTRFANACSWGTPSTSSTLIATVLSDSANAVRTRTGPR
jgi:hypothetical protein